MKIAAITGTNGKSSTISFAQQMLEKENADVWTITNTGIREPDGSSYSLFWLREKGCIKKLLDVLPVNDESIVLIEAYSISILAEEWEGLKLDAAVFTSFGRDHLDIHENIELYFHVKFKLFQEGLRSGGTAIVNDQVPYLEKFQQLAKKNNFELNFYENNIGRNREDTNFLLENYRGAQHLYRALKKTNSIASYKSLIPLPGRIQEVQNSRGIKIYIDYAHNPNALSFVLNKITPSIKGKIFTVFGCGGDRDPGKRFQMGSIAADLSDYVIITDDNPRTENPILIRNTIMKGCPKALEIYPREEAIKHAVLLANTDDCIIVCGMGNDKWFNQTLNRLTNDEEVLINILFNN